VNNRTIVISVAVGALLLIWAAFFMPSSKDDGAAAAPVAHEPSEAASGAQAPAPSVAPPTSAQEEPAPTPEAPPERTRTKPELPHTAQRPEKMGPFEELKARYASDARDAEAGATEERIRKLLKQPEIPEGMLREISCLKSVCKLDLRWTTNDSEAYMILMMSLVTTISQKLAAAPAGADEGQPVHPLEVYVSRIDPPLDPTPPR